VGTVCSVSSDMLNAGLTVAFAVFCVVWAWKLVSQKIIKFLSVERATANADDFTCTIKLLRQRRERCLSKVFGGVIQGVDKQRAVEDAGCYEEAIRRLFAMRPR
jgi:hypothetical protein